MLRSPPVWVPLLVPFGFSLEIEWSLLLDHTAALHEAGVGMLLFAPAAEGEALSLAEKLDMLHRLARYPCHSNALLPSTTCQTLPESVELTRAALALGYGTVQLRVPSTHALASDASLSRFFIEVIEQADPLGRFVLEQPPGRGAPTYEAVTRRLAEAYPSRVIGVEVASAGTVASGLHHEGMLACQPEPASRPGKPLAAPVALLANVMAGDYLNSAPASEFAADKAGPFKGLPPVACVKHMLGRRWRRAEWTCVRPPLQALSASQRQRLDRWMSRTGQM